MKSPAAFVLEVRGGHDHGTSLRLGTVPGTIGRARDCDLMLRDLGVSRRHLRAFATEDGVQFDVAEGAGPFVVDGKALRSAKLRPGQQLLVGSTFLVVGADGPPPPRPSASGFTDVGTVLTGISADAQAMLAIHTLIDLLDSAREVAALESSLKTWARQLVTVMRRGDRTQLGERDLEDRVRAMC